MGRAEGSTDASHVQGMHFSFELSKVDALFVGFYCFYVLRANGHDYAQLPVWLMSVWMVLGSGPGYRQSKQAEKDYVGKPVNYNNYLFTRPDELASYKIQQIWSIMTLHHTYQHFTFTACSSCKRVWMC